MRYIKQIPMRCLATKGEVVFAAAATLPGTASEQFEEAIDEIVSRNVARILGQEAPPRKLPLPNQTTFLSPEN